MSVVKYTETVFTNQNKQGILKPDENGYYTLVIGGLNTYNSAQEFYTLNKSRALFENSSSFMRRVQSGALYGELGHPKKLPGMSEEDFYRRVISIEETNICLHISEVWLDEQYSQKVPHANAVGTVAIMGKVKPAGPHAESARLALENPKQSCALSIRSLTDNKYVNGRIEKTITSVITFDWVPEPGIHIAAKDKNPGLESITSSIHDHSTFVNKDVMREVLQKQMKHTSMESSRMLFNEVLNSMREDKPRGKTIADW